MKHCLSVLFCLLALVSATSAAATRPNVVVFLADDAGWGDYSRNGNTCKPPSGLSKIDKGLSKSS